MKKPRRTATPEELKRWQHIAEWVIAGGLGLWLLFQYWLHLVKTGANQ